MNKDNVSTSEAVASLSTDLKCSLADWVSKTRNFYNESTFQANHDQRTFWSTKDMQNLKPKSRSSGIMVLDIIEEHNGYPHLSDVEYREAVSTHRNAKKNCSHVT